MPELDFDAAFKALTGHPPFPWQRALYARFASGDIPVAATLPTGLGKTSVIAVWLIALANGKPVPRRLVYVVNRRTVVDQTTDEVEKYVKRKVDGIPEFAVSTLRGQFADNREWSADPSRPAVICGTVDMIGSRLLFSGYGCGFKTRPLHAGFLGQDSLLIHDEAHLEPAFQKLLEAIRDEQQHERTIDLPWPKLRVMELTATTRGGEKAFELTDAEKAIPEQIPDPPAEPIHRVWRRLKAKKGLRFHPAKRDALATTIGETARDKWKDSGKAILIFVRTIDDVKAVTAALTVKKTGVPAEQVQTLTGTLRGLERDRLTAADEVFARFMPEPKVRGKDGTVYLVCTSAGEVGVDISADHMVCDLTTLDSMAQRLGRVNRRGDGAAEIDVVCESDPNPKPPSPEFETARWKAKGVLERLPRCDWIADRLDASPSSLGAVMKSLSEDERDAAFAPRPTILPTSDILFDAWALTTIRDRLPGRPHVEPYLHGLPTAWQPAETHIAWRAEVERLDVEPWTEWTEREFARFAADLLDDYPLKPHELLREPSYRAFKQFEAMAKRVAGRRVPVWLVDDEGEVEVFTLADLADKDNKERIEGKTVLLPPSAGGLNGGMLDGTAAAPDTGSLDVADELFVWDREEKSIRQRNRLWNADPDADPDVADMHEVRTIEFPGSEDDEESDGDAWQWFAMVNEGNKSAKKPVLWTVHVADVEREAEAILKDLSLPHPLRTAVKLAARFHDHGKRRKVFQQVLGNFGYPGTVALAKSGKKGSRFEERYRHEFGSLIDLEAESEFRALTDEDQKDLVRHLIATHHGRGRPHFPADEAFDPEHGGTEKIAAEVPRRFARLQRKYGRWGLAYLESLLRAADYAASANPSAFVGGEE